MKKKLLIAVGSIAWVIFCLGLLMSWNYYRSLPGYHVPGTMQGNSMSEYGLGEGVDIDIYINEICEVGDFCEWTCASEKCEHSSGEGYPSVKLLSDISDNCYFFEGNKNPWKEDSHPGQTATSHDSRVFGCLMPDEFEMHGVVRK